MTSIHHDSTSEENTKTLEIAVKYVLELAKQKGLEADVIASAGESFSLKADQGELTEYKVTASQVIGVRIIKDQRVAISYSESFESAQLDYMVDQAFNNTSFTKKDPTQQIRAENLQINTEYPEINQKDKTTTEEKIALALQLENLIREKTKVKSAPYNGYGESSSRLIFANTLNTFCRHSARSLSCYTSALLDDKNKQSMSVKACVGRTFSELTPNQLITDAYQLALDLLDGAPVSTGTYSVIFEQSCLNQLFGAFGSAFSGEAAKRGINPWRNKLNESVASPLLTFTDMSYIKGGHAIKSFDGEGFKTGDTPLIEQGKLVGFLHNSSTAAHFGLPHTANAGRSAKSTLGVASRHDVIQTGSSSLAELTAGEYLELVELQGVHSGADAISGDFSFGASGFLCRDGKRVQPVRGITVAGNFFRLLHRIEAVGDTLVPTYDRCFFSPLIRFEQLNIAGK